MYEQNSGIFSHKISQALEKIIERDFFPDLPKLRAQNEYLTAFEQGDLDKVQEVCKKYNTPRRMPSL